MPETVVHFQIRMPPALHERLASLAMDQKSSLNALVVSILQEAAKEGASEEQREATGTMTDPARDVDR